MLAPLIILTAALWIATVVILFMRRRISRLQKENLKLQKRVFRLLYADKEKALDSNEPYWQKIDPSDLADSIDDQGITKLN